MTGRGTGGTGRRPGVAPAKENFHTQTCQTCLNLGCSPCPRIPAVGPARCPGSLPPAMPSPGVPVPLVAHPPARAIAGGRDREVPKPPLTLRLNRGGDRLEKPAPPTTTWTPRRTPSSMIAVPRVADSGIGGNSVLHRRSR